MQKKMEIQGRGGKKKGEKLAMFKFILSSEISETEHFPLQECAGSRIQSVEHLGSLVISEGRSIESVWYPTADNLDAHC